MENKYNSEIHRRRSVRLYDYDYSQAGLYYATLCVQNRECVFGKMVDEKMVLNECGKIIDDIWNEMPQHYPFAILHNHIVMPNHFHGVVEITNARRGAIYRARNIATNDNRGAISQHGAVNQGAINRAPTPDTIYNE